MMRILFLFFLLLNAAYLYFQFEDSDGTTSNAILAEAPLPPGVEKLTLLRERGLGVKSAAPLPTKPVPGQQQDKEDRPRSNEPAASASRELVANKTPAKQPAKADQLQQIRIEKSKESACFTLGPFEQARLASSTADAIIALGVEVKRRQESKRVPKAYWVYLPPSNSYQTAKRKVTELQKKGLTDLFIMGDGSRKNAISLGLFKSKEIADERFEQVNKLGLNAVFETQYRFDNEDWLDMTVPGDQTATVAKIIEMAEGLEKVELTQRKCQ